MDIFDQIGLLLDWLFTGIYDFVVDTASYLIQLSIKLSLVSTLAFVEFSWSIAKDMMNDLGISELIDSMYSNFSSQIMDVLLFFKIPEFINSIMSAYMTKFVFSFLGGKGLL
ncbi:MAG: DUF2523 family protein [Thiolinea sp.]